MSILSITGKNYLTETWEHWFLGLKEGDEITIPWKWRYDRDRLIMKRWRKKGYFKQRNKAPGMDRFIRTDKVFVKGDYPRRSIKYSKDEKDISEGAEDR